MRGCPVWWPSPDAAVRVPCQDGESARGILIMTIVRGIVDTKIGRRAKNRDGRSGYDAAGVDRTASHLLRRVTRSAVSRLHPRFGMGYCRETAERTTGRN